MPSLFRPALSTLFLLVLAGLAGCSRGGETGLAGQLLFQDRPLAGAQVEIYLRGDKDRSTSPFASTATDADGRYRLTLPPGRYFVIGKKRVDDGGHPRMLMAECPANPIEVQEGMRPLAAFSLREMGRDGALVPEPGTGVRGRTVSGGQPLADTYVYVYTESASGLMGPSYGEALRSAADGTFQIELPAGRFFLAARKRADGGRSGEVDAGDLNGSYPGNPVTVQRGTMLELGDLPLSPVDAGVRAERMHQGKFARTGTLFTGRIVDQDGKPIKGVYVFAYLDSRMVGKPTYISAATAADGRFELHLGAGGTYFVGARSTYGGPLEPGEWVGTYDGSPDHAARAGKGQTVALGEIVVREVW